jgi:glutaredoxin
MRSNVLSLEPGKFALSAATLAVFAMAALFVTMAHAQVYRIVGPDGKVTISDQPPVASGNAKVSTGNAGAPGGGAGAALPFELRQVATKYPVTLYVGDNCGPCGAGRSLLTSRGVPFVEKTVNTNEDIQALQRLGGESSLPFLTIGSQQLKGFSDTEWSQFLDAAGYPKSSQLPASYRQAAATPLVTAAPVAAPAAAPRTPPQAARPAPAVAPAANNPAGIRF